jgi:hypothetical protein
MSHATLSPDGRTITVRIPIRLQRPTGRKVIIAPDGSGDWAPRPRIDNTLVKALARAYRWKRLMENGSFASMTELAAYEKVDQSYIARILRLALLAPDIIEAILDGRQPRSLSLAQLMRAVPVEWVHQRTQLAQPPSR